MWASSWSESSFSSSPCASLPSGDSPSMITMSWEARNWLILSQSSSSRARPWKLSSSSFRVIVWSCFPAFSSRADRRFLNSGSCSFFFSSSCRFFSCSLSSASSMSPVSALSFFMLYPPADCPSVTGLLHGDIFWQEGQIPFSGILFCRDVVFLLVCLSSALSLHWPFAGSVPAPCRFLVLCFPAICLPRT